MWQAGRSVARGAGCANLNGSLPLFWAGRDCACCFIAPLRCAFVRVAECAYLPVCGGSLLCLDSEADAGAFHLLPGRSLHSSCAGRADPAWAVWAECGGGGESVVEPAVAAAVCAVCRDAGDGVSAACVQCGVWCGECLAIGAVCGPVQFAGSSSVASAAAGGAVSGGDEPAGADLYRARADAGGNAGDCGGVCAGACAGGGAAAVVVDRGGGGAAECAV